MYSSDGLSVSNRGLNAGCLGDLFADFTDLPSLLVVLRRDTDDLLNSESGDLLPSFTVSIFFKSDS